MSAAIGKFFNPATYAQTWAIVKTRAHAYYHPMIRANRYDFCHADGATTGYSFSLL